MGHVVHLSESIMKNRLIGSSVAIIDVGYHVSVADLPPTLNSDEGRVILVVNKVGIFWVFLRVLPFPHYLSTKALHFPTPPPFMSIIFLIASPAGCHPALKPWTWLAVPSPFIQSRVFGVIMRNFESRERANYSGPGSYRDSTAKPWAKGES